MTRREREEAVLKGVEFLLKENPGSWFKVYSNSERTHAVVDAGSCRWKVTASEGERNWRAKTC